MKPKWQKMAAEVDEGCRPKPLQQKENKILIGLGYWVVSICLAVGSLWFLLFSFDAFDRKFAYEYVFGDWLIACGLFAFGFLAILAPAVVCYVRGLKSFMSIGR